MFLEHARRIEADLSEHAVVLDIGGWAQPFNRADYVVDLQPYETRGVFGSVGEATERFSKDSWVVQDVNSRDPLPFPDKFFDFVICSHTLEDVRDPVAVSAEIVRVGKAGYIETPSRRVETTWGIEGPYVGYYHHRWLVEVTGQGLEFRLKPHSINGARAFHFPRSSAASLPEIDRISFLFWEELFDCCEVIQISRELVERDLASFVDHQGGYAKRAEVWDRSLQSVKHPRRFIGTLARRSSTLTRLAAVVRNTAPAPEADPSLWESLPDLLSRAHGSLASRPREWTAQEAERRGS